MDSECFECMYVISMCVYFFFYFRTYKDVRKLPPKRIHVCMYVLMHVWVYGMPCMQKSIQVCCVCVCVKWKDVKKFRLLKGVCMYVCVYIFFWFEEKKKKRIIALPLFCPIEEYCYGRIIWIVIGIVLIISTHKTLMPGQTKRIA